MIAVGSKVLNALENDLPIAWILKITLDSVNYYFGSNIQVTVSSHLYAGGFVIQGGLGDISQGMDILEGGGIDYIGAVEIQLNNFADENFVHKYFPPFSANQWINRKVEIGIIANDGSTLSDSDAMWVYTGRIDHYNSNLTTVSLDVMDYQEQFETDLPSIIIDKQSYPNAPKENLGLPLPILYGDFLTPNTLDFDGFYVERIRACPAICVNSSYLRFCVAGHPVHSADEHQFYRTGSMRNFGVLEVLLVGGFDFVVGDADDSGLATISILPGSIYCLFSAFLVNAGEVNEVVDFQNAVDGDDSTVAHIQVAVNEYLSMQVDGVPSGTVFAAFRLLSYAVGAHKYDVGYLAEGEGIGSFHSITSHDAGASAGYVFDSVSLVGLSSNELSKYQWVLRCDSATEIAAIRNFSFAVDILLSQRNIPVGLTRPTFKGGRHRAKN